MSISIYDVAQRAGLSIATVSRVLNSPEKVRPASVARVQKAMNELGYTANNLAQRFASQRSYQIGVLLPHNFCLNSTYVTECLEGIREVLAEQGYHILLLFEDAPGDRSYEQLLRCRMIDGLLALSRASVLPVLDRLAATPDCSLGYIGKSGDSFACNVYAGYENYTLDIFRRLKAAGHDSILYVAGLEENRRYVETRRQADTSGRYPATVLSLAQDTCQAAEWSDQFEAYLHRAVEQGCTAVFADTAVEAARVLAFCRRRAITVPKQLSLATVFQGQEECEQFQLTGIDAYWQPTRRMGRALAEMVLRRIQGVHRPEFLIIDGEYRSAGSIYKKE